jgi:transcriptional regulator of acetoin/glycerol metabolism
MTSKKWVDPPIRRTSSERDELVHALKITRWNKSQTAEILKWSRMTVYRKIDQYGLTSEPGFTQVGNLETEAFSDPD